MLVVKLKYCVTPVLRKEYIKKLRKTHLLCYVYGVRYLKHKSYENATRYETLRHFVAKALRQESLRRLRSRMTSSQKYAGNSLSILLSW